jgi:hypothetical protein
MAAFLKKELEDSGFVVNEIIDNLIIVENFISAEEIVEYFDIINKSTEADWKKEYLDNLVPFCLEKFGRDDIQNLVAEGKLEITENWEDKNLKLNGYDIADKIGARLRNIVNQSAQNLVVADLKTFQRMYEGTELKAHTDQDTDPSIRYATIGYLNEDYFGGEIFFTHKNLKLKPKPGSLLIFPGTEEFHHGVTHVEAGPIRYVLVGFIKEEEFYENNKY